MGNGEHELKEGDLRKLAENEVNGREIKNIVKTARLLCKQQKMLLGMRHLEMVLRVKRGDFRSAGA